MKGNVSEKGLWRGEVSHQLMSVETWRATFQKTVSEEGRSLISSCPWRCEGQRFRKWSLKKGGLSSVHVHGDVKGYASENGLWRGMASHQGSNFGNRQCSQRALILMSVIKLHCTNVKLCALKVSWWQLSGPFEKMEQRGFALLKSKETFCHIQFILKSPVGQNGSGSCKNMIEYALGCANN